MDVDLIFKIAAIGIIVSILNQVLSRSGRDEQATMTTLAGLVVVLMMLAQEISRLFDLVKQLATEERLTITQELCTNLYAAISADTGGFRYSNVTSETHLRAAELLESGIDTASINHLLFSSRTMEELRAQAAAISNLQLHANGKIAFVSCPYALKVALGLDDSHLDTLVDVARSLRGVCVAASIRQPGTEGSFRVSVRSSCGYDVSALCVGFGGGGHTKAAGCTIEAADADEAMQKLVAAIDVNALD
jgi:phosphoesterase RecJ-like protein